MNRCYRIIWSYSRSLFVVVAENVRSRTKGAASKKYSRNASGHSFKLSPLKRAFSILYNTTLLAFSAVATAQAQLPSGAQVVAGNAQFSQDANTLTVAQDSAKLITNWQSFNIGAENTVNFQQPSVDAVALNRILGSNSSEIYGSLTANGQVFLVNPNGILFAEGSRVDVGSLVASTLDISNENFLQGNYVFEGDGSSATIRNQGVLSAAQGGAIALLGGQVRNDGLIAARLGTAALAAGDQVTLDFAGDGLLEVRVDRATVDALVTNNQLIKADGGVVFMTAKASDALLKTVVNNTGVVEAHTVAERDGKILLLGGFNGGTVEVAGTLDASAPNGGDAGFIETSGAHVDFGNATILASASDGQAGQWLVDPEDVVIDEAHASTIETTLNTNVSVTIQTGIPGEPDSAPSERGNITVDAPILVTKSPAQFTGDVERTLTARGDVLPGIETEALAEGVSVVYLNRYEINANNDENLVSRTLMESSAANSALSAGDPANPLFSKYEITAVPDDVDVVNVVTREVGNVATLSLISGKGNITVNEPIRSINGAVNIVMRAGSEAGTHARDESVFINADLLSNGGDIAVQANANIKVADGVTLSTRDIFGINRSEARVVGTEVNQIDPSRFVQASQISAYTEGESGNIVLMTDKFANGFTNFVLFYRSDVVGIDIGEGAALLAESNEARDGSIRLLSVAKIGDVFESINWLAVRNFSASEINIGKDAKIIGGAVDVIADAAAEADVGNLVESFVTNVATDTLEATSPVITINEDDSVNTAMETYNSFTDITADPFAVNDAATQAAAGNVQASDLPGYEVDVKNTPKVASLAGKKAGKGLSTLIEKVPVIGDILTLSPFAIAIAESQSTVKVNEGALISGTDVVTVRANSNATTMADAKFPGLAFSLTVNNSKANLEVDSGAKIVSTAQDRQEPTSQLLNDQPLLRFDTTQVESFGVARGYLDISKRGSLAAVDVAAVSNTSSTIKVTAATLALDAQERLADNAATQRAIKDGSTEVPAPEDKRAIDSPVDISLGIMIGDNESSLSLAKDAQVEANSGTATVRSEAHVLKANNTVTGGKLQSPDVQCTAAVSSDCHTTKEYDASDIVNMAVAIGSTTNKATATIEGNISAKTVAVSTLAETHKYSNGAVSEQGYDNEYSQDDAESKMRSKLSSKTSSAQKQQSQNAVKGLSTSLNSQVQGKTGANTKTKVTLLEEGPDNQLFGLAGAVTVSVINQNAYTYIGKNAELKSNGGTLDVSTVSHSGIINNYAKTGVQNGRTNAVAASVALGVYSYDADTMVDDGALFRAINPQVSAADLELGRSSAISVVSQSYIDSPFLESKYQKATYKTDMKAAKLYGVNGVKALKGFTTGAKENDIVDYARSRVNDLLDNGQLLTTNWATSYYINGGSPAYQGTGSFNGTETDSNGNKINPPTDELNAKTDYSSDVSVAGAFGLLTTDNNASTVIGDATFEVVNGKVDNANDITIGAETWSHTVMAGGNIAPPDPNTDNPLETFAPGDRAGKGVGGSLNIQEGSSTVNVDIKDGASFDTALGTMAALANNHRETQLVQVSGGLAADIGVNGAFGINVFDDKVSSHVADGALINAKGVNVGTTIRQPGVFNLSGGFAVGGAVGVGVGVGINVVNRESDAVLGYVGTGDQAGTDGQYNVDELAVVAIQEGFITNIDVAGGIQAPEGKGKTVQGGAGTTATSQTSTDPADKSTGGVGASGSVAINISNASTQAEAFLNDGSSIADVATVRADDAVDITGLSGAAGITVNGGVAVAGAASINTVQSDTDAILSAQQSNGDFALNGAAYTPYDVDVSAANIGKIQAVALGIAVVGGAPSDDGGEAKVSAAVAGSFTYNSVRNDAFADIRNSRLQLSTAPAVTEDDEDDAGISVIANDGAQIISVAGAVAISAGKENNVAAVGGSVAVNTIQNRTDAQIDNSLISDADNSDDSQIIVGASHIAPIYSFAVAGSAGSSKVALAGSAVINTINTEENMGTFAGIKNSTITSDGDTSVYSGDEAQIVSLGGAVAGTSGNAAVGGAFVWNEISGSTLANVSDSTINSDDGINILSVTESPNAVPDAPLPTVDELKESATKVGKDVAIIVGRGALGALQVRNASNAPTVAPVDSNDLVDGSNGIYTAAVAGGGSKDVAVFGSFAVNSLHKTVATTVSDSVLTSSGDILMSSQADAVIRSLAGAIAVSLGNVGVGGAGTYNTIRDKSLVSLENSNISGQNVLANAGRSGSVKTLGAAAGIASTVGVQGSTAITTLAGETAATVQGGTINAQERAVIGADSTVDTVTSAGGVAGSGTAAVGASLALTVAEDSTSSSVGESTASTVNAKTAVDIKAESLDQHDTGVMTGALGVGGAGVAGAVGIKVVNTTTSASVGANSQLNQLAGYNGTINVLSDASLALTGAAGAIGGGAYAGVGAGLDLNVVNSVSSATIGDGAVLSGLDVYVNANNQRDISSMAVAGGGGLVGVAGAVSVIHVGGGEMAIEGSQALGQADYEDDNGQTQREEDVMSYAQALVNSDFTTAKITNTPSSPIEGDTLAYVGTATITATRDIEINASAKHDVDVNSGALGGGAVGAGAGVASVTYNSKTRAVTNNAQLNAQDDVSVKALDVDENTHTAWWLDDYDQSGQRNLELDLRDGDDFGVQSFAGAAGIAALGAAVTVVDRDNDTSAEIRGGSTMATDRIDVIAERNRYNRASTFGAQVGAAAVGASISDVHNDGQVLASAGGEIGSDSVAGTRLTIEATGDNKNDALSFAAAGGVLTVTGSVAAIKGASLDLDARIADDATVRLKQKVLSGESVLDSDTGRVDMSAKGQNADRALADGNSVSAGVGVGATETRVSTTSDVDVAVGNDADLEVQGLLSFTADMKAASLDNDDIYEVSNDVESRGLAQGLITGVASTVAVSEQDVNAGVTIGERTSIDAGRITLDSSSLGGSHVLARGGAFAGLAGINSINAFDLDHYSSHVTIEGDATLTANTIEFFSDSINMPRVQTAAISGGIANATLSQFANTRNHEKTRELRSLSTITMADGASSESVNNTTISSLANFAGYTQGNGSAGGASAITVVNSDFAAQHSSSIEIGAAQIQSGRTLSLESTTQRNLLTNFDAAAFGAGAGATINLGADVSGSAEINLQDGAEIAGEDVVLHSKDEQINHSLKGIAEIGAAVGAADTFVDSDIAMNQAVNINTGAKVRGSSIDIKADEGLGSRISSVDITQKNSSLTFFLEADKQSINHLYTPSIELGGDLYSSATGNGTLNINHQFNGLLINGRNALFEPVPYASLENNLLTISNLTPAAGEGAVKLNAGVGAVTGTGKIVNSGGFFDTIEITSTGSIDIAGLSMLGESGDAPSVSITSGNAYTPNVVNASGTTPSLTVEAKGNIRLTGDIDVGTGSLSLVALGTLVNSNGDITQGDALSMRAGSLVVRAENGSVGTQANPINVSFLDNSAESDASLVGAAIGDGARGDFYVNTTLEGSAANLNIGDIQARDSIGLSLGALIGGGDTVYTLGSANTISTLGQLDIDATADGVGFVLDGQVTSGFEVTDSSIDIVIETDGSISSDWAALTTSSTPIDIDKRTLTLGSITRESGGVNINATNLSGSGSVTGNSGGLDINITNNDWSVGKLFLHGINMESVDVAVTINGDTSAASIGDISVSRLSSSGENSINIVDNFSNELVLLGDIRTDGKVTMDLAGVELLHRADSEIDPIIKADALEIDAAFATTVGYESNPLKLELGEGGLDLTVGGTVNLRQIAGDLVINAITTYPLDSVTTASANIAVEDGSLIAAGGAGIFAQSIDFTASDDIDLSATSLVLLGTSSFDANNISVLADNLAFESVTARGDLSATATGSISGGPVQVAGNTSLQAAEVVLNNSLNDFQGQFAYKRTGAGDVALTLFDRNDLILGEVNAFTFDDDGADTTQLFITARGNITQASDTKIFTQRNLTLVADEDILLTQAANWFDGASINTSDTRNLSVRTNQTTGIDLRTISITGDLLVEADAGPITQSSALNVGGDSQFISGDNLTLQQSNNRFTGAVSLDIAGDVKLASNTSIDLANVDIIGYSTITSGAGDITDSGTIAFGNDALLQAPGGDIILDSADNRLGKVGGTAVNVTLVDGSALFGIYPFDITGKLSLDGNNIAFLTQLSASHENKGLYAASNTLGALDLVSRVGTIEFPNPSNPSESFVVTGDVSITSELTVLNNTDFRGAIGFHGSNSAYAEISNNADGSNVILGDSNVGTLLINVPSGNISQKADTSISASIIELRAQGDISLNGSQNDFDDLNILNGTNVTIVDKDDLRIRADATNIADFNVANLNVTAGEIRIGQSQNTLIDTGLAATSIVRVSNDLTLTASAGNIYDDTNILNIDSSGYHVGNLTQFTASGSIGIDNLASSYAQAININAGSNAYVLTSYLANIGGSDRLAALPLVLGNIRTGGDFTAQGTRIEIASLDIGGDLDLSTDYWSVDQSVDGSIFSNGVVSVAGTSVLRSIGDITFANSSNSFGGAVSISDRTPSAVHRVNPWNFELELPSINVDLASSSPMLLGAISMPRKTGVRVWTGPTTFNTVDQIAGTLSIDATGGISQASAIEVAGVTNFTASNGAINLDHADNEFSGTVSAQGQSVTIQDQSSLTLGSVSTSAGDLTVVAGSLAATQTISVSGNVDLRTNKGDLDAQAIVATGNAYFTAADVDGLRDVSLTNTNSQIDGSIAADADNFTFYSAGDLVVGNITTDNALSLQSVSGSIGFADGSLTQVGGDASLTSSAGELALTGNGFNVSGQLNLSAQNVQLSSSDDVKLGLIDILDGGAGNLVVSGKSITILDEIDVPNLASFTATDGNLIYDAGNTKIIAGSANLYATGDIYGVFGSASDWGFQLDVPGVVNVRGHDVELNNSADEPIFGAVTTTGDLKLNIVSVANGSITQTGAFDIAGDLNIDSFISWASKNTHRLVLSNVNNRIGGSLNLRVADADVYVSNDVTLGNIRMDGGSSSDGSFILTTTGDVTSDSYINMDGNSSITSGGNIVLSDIDTGSGSVSLSAHNITVDSFNGLRLGAVTASGDLSIEARGIVANEKMLVSGNSYFGLRNNTRIGLNNTGNEFNGTVSIVGASTASLTSKYGFNLMSVELESGDFSGQGQGQGKPSPEGGEVDDYLTPAVLTLNALDGDIVAQGPVIADSVRLYLDDGRHVVMDNVGNRLGYEGGEAPTEYDPEFFAQSLGPNGLLGSIRVTDSSDLHLLPSLNYAEDSIADMHASGDMVFRSLGDITLRNGTETSNATALLNSAGNIVLAAGQDFDNLTGNTDPLAAAGRWLVYSERPDHNSNDMAMSRDFLSFGKYYDASTPIPSGLAPGNGLLFSIRPQLEGVSLEVNPQSIVYGENIDTSVSAAELSDTVVGVSFDGDVIADPSIYGITLPSTINPEDLQVSLDESVITRSNGGFINTGTYATGLQVAFKEGTTALEGLRISGTGTLNVSPRDLQVSVGDISKVYDGLATAQGTAELVSGFSLMPGDALSGGGFTFADVNAGSNKIVNVTDVTVNDGNSGQNYALSYIANNNSVITPAQLLVTANNVTRTYDGNAFTGGDGAVFSGFVNGETQSVLSGTLTYGGTSQGAVNAGNYTITPAGLNADNYQLNFVDGTLNINTASLSLGLAADDKSKVYGEADPLFTYQITDGALVGGDSLTGSLARDAGENVGNYRIHQGSLTAGSNYAITFADGNLEITQRAITITSADVSKTYDGTTSATSTAITTADTSLRAGDSLVGGTFAFLDPNAGENKSVVVSDVVISDGNDGNNYTFAYAPNTTSTITPATLTVTANDLTRTYDGTAFSGGNGVVYSGFVNSETESVVSGTVAYTGTSQGAVAAGDYAITPSGLNAANYIFDYVDGKLKIQQAGLSLGVAADDKSKIYGDADPVFTFQITDGALIGSDTFTGSLEREAGENVGAYAINLGSLSAGSNYAIDFVGGTLSILARDITVTASDVVKTYDGTTAAVANPILHTGLLVGSDSLSGGSYAFAHPNAGQNRAVNVSGVTVNDGNNGSNYNVTYAANTSSTINPAALVVSAADLTRVYDGVEFTGGTEVTYSGFVNGEGTEVLGGTLNFSGSSQNAVDAGTYAITPSGYITGNYEITYVDGALRILPAGISLLGVGADDKSKIYGELDPEFTYQITEGALVDGDSFSGSLTREPGENVGNYAITQGSLSAGGNYELSFTDGVLSIQARDISISTAAVTKTYDGSGSALGSAIVSAGTLIGSDSLSGGSFVFEDVNVGSNKNIIVSGVSVNDGNSGNNYNVSYSPSTEGRIDPASLTVSANSTTRTYDGTAFTGGAGVTYSGFVNGETEAVLTGDLAYGGSSQGAVDAGDYTISLSGLNASNYAISYNDGALKILPAGLTLMSIAADDKTKTYGDADPAFTYQITDGALVEGDSISGALSRESGENVGSYAIQQGSLSAGSNYVLSFTDGVLQITPRDISVSAGTIVKTYDGTTVASGSPILSSGSLASGDSLSGGTFAFLDANAGSDKTINVSDVILSDGNGGNNYNLSYTPSNSGVINPAALTVSAQNVIQEYNGAAFAGGAGVTYSGFVNGESSADLAGSIVYGGTSQGAIDAGDYSISLSGLSSSNYAINYVDGSLKIYPIGLTLLGVGADNKSKIYGDADPEFTYQFTEGALLDGDSLTGELTRDPGENVGNYSIRQGSLSAGDNYIINFANGVLNIAPRSVTISSSDVFKTYDGNTSAAAVAALSSGSLVSGDSLVGGTFAFLDPNAGSGKTVTVSGVSIADGNGGNNYTVSFANNTTSRIDRASLSLVAEDFERSYNGDAYSGGAGFSISGFVNGEGQEVLSGSIDYSGTSQGAVDAGEYSIIPGGLSAQNYNIAVSPGVLTITKANLALGITADNQTKVYGEADPSFSYSISSGELVGSDTLSGSLSREPGKNVGTYAITVGSLTAGSNYVISVSGGSLSITPRAVTISSSDVVKVYDGTTAAIGNAVVAGGSLAGGDSLSGGSFSFDDANAGSGKTVSVAGVQINDGNGGANYSVSVVPNTTSTINKAVVTLTPTTDTRVYDGTTQSSAAVAIEGLVGGDSITGLKQEFESADAGTRTLIVTGFEFGDSAAAANYEVVKATATGVIEQALLTIAPQDQSKVFGAVFDFSGSEFTIVDGALQGSDQVVSVTLLSDGVAADAAPGTYSISVAGAEGTGLQNYAISFQDAPEGFTVEAPATKLNDVLSTVVTTTGNSGGTTGTGGTTGGVGAGIGGTGSGGGATGGGVLTLTTGGAGAGGAGNTGGVTGGATGGATGTTGGGAGAPAPGGAVADDTGGAGPGGGADLGNDGDTSTDGDDSGSSDDEEEEDED